MNILWVVVIDTGREQRWEVVAAPSGETASRLVGKGLPTNSSVAAFPVADVTESDLGTHVLTSDDRGLYAMQSGVAFRDRYLELKARLDTVRAVAASPSVDAEGIRRAVENAASTPWVMPTDRAQREWLVSLAIRSLAQVHDELKRGHFTSNPELQGLQREYAEQVQSTLDILGELSENW